jgi:predicted RNA-binding Zn ribbon-like protein
MHLAAIPSTLSPYLCVDFVNSRFEDHRGSGRIHDRLELEEWRAWFVDRCGLGAPPPFTPSARTRLVALREFLRRGLESGAAPDLKELNEYLAASSRVPQVAGGGAALQLAESWTADGWPAVIALVAESYAELLVGGGLARVRVCANPDCSFVFYDESRNGSRRWCDVRACGNLMRVRRHRGLHS